MLGVPTSQSVRLVERTLFFHTSLHSVFPRSYRISALSST